MGSQSMSGLEMQLFPLLFDEAALPSRLTEAEGCI